jgi:Ca-activated chloride channel family protein
MPRTRAFSSLIALGLLTACAAAPYSHQSSAPSPEDTPMSAEMDDAAGDAAEAPNAAAPRAQMRQSAPMAAGAPAPPAARPATTPAERRVTSSDADRAPAQPKKKVAAVKRDKKLQIPSQLPSVAPEPAGTEQYTDHGVNPVVDTLKDAMSTFAVDVDTASYAIARSKLRGGALPPFQSVRAEEFVNYFDYGYAPPTSAPFNVHLNAAPSPFQRGHHIIRVGLQAKKVSKADRTPVHLVYLVDTSGSMRTPNKLGLAKKSLEVLTDQLKAGDTVALCTYAGATRLVLPPTGGNEKAKIKRAIRSLSAGGGTAMSDGMEMAYEQARRTMVSGHINRVIVLSDGDANIGRSNHQGILQRIGHYKNMGITLSTIGFGRGNYKDTMMEQLANKGDGNYSYIDTARESQRVFGEQINGLLQVVAKDVKVQVNFDPSVVKSYRLIGYENRDVADRDFRNDKVDAGEIGAGHNVTALYDVVLRQPQNPGRSRTPIIVLLRHKLPNASRATEQSFKLTSREISSSFETAPANLRFATAVAGLAEVLRKSPHARNWSLASVERIGRAATWGRPEQAEFLSLVRRARRLSGERSPGGAAIMAK